jgi:hypothetical protein
MVFGTFAERRHFSYPSPDTYDGVVINANMAAHAPAGLAAFLLERTGGIRYVIDPLTHAFQHDTEAITDKDGKLKSSIRALAEAYGEPVLSRVGERPVQPSHFNNVAVVDAFVHKCLGFQLSQVCSRMAESDAAKYLDAKEEFRPYAVVAPYFYLSEATLEDWLPVNMRCAHAAIDYVSRGQPRLYASVVVSQGVITNPDTRGRVVKAYSALDVAGYLLWVDALDEQAASGPELSGLVELARGLRMGGQRDVLNLHGGYFSVLAAGPLGGNVISGVAHGPEFGEYREVVPVGGGIPIARYYIPELHARVRYRDALRVFQAGGWLGSAKSFHTEVCDCRACKKVIAGDPANFHLFGDGTVKSVRRRHGIVRIEFPTVEAKLRCLEHYLCRKDWEYHASANADSDALLRNLVNGAKKYQEVAGLDAVAHLRLWHKLFSGSIPGITGV